MARPTQHQTDIALKKWLDQHTSKELLRFLTCGSVDDGKSTLIGRLLYDSQLVLDDQLANLKSDSMNRPVSVEGFDFSLLVDGLSAEREQGITIDVAYRFFETDKRKFIVADTPGHEQYTRNMAIGASNCDLALILVDARKGITTQTRRHCFVLSLFGVRQVVLAVNKIDQIDYDESVFNQIEHEFRTFTSSLDFAQIQAIPISALNGDNIVTASLHTDWYHGPRLVPYLENVDVCDACKTTDVRFPVQWVNRTKDDFRGFCGTLEAGNIKVDDVLRVTSSGKTARVSNIVTMDGSLSQATTGQAITLQFDRELDISRGDMLSGPDQKPQYSNQFQARLLWMHDELAHPGRSYLLKSGYQTVPATITGLKHIVNIDTLEKLPARHLDLNEVGIVSIATDRAIAFDAYAEHKSTGGFILIERISNATVGAGTIDFGLRRAQNLTYQHFDVNREVRAHQKGQTPAIVWLTGLSGSGKSTIANLLEKRLTAEGKHVYILDGDNVRHGLNKDLGFTDTDRVENIRRVGEVARLMADAGLIVIVSFISPFTNERKLAREIAGDIKFIEAYVDTPFSVCEQRDPKGLYAKARAGKIKNFTGLDSAFEAPEQADIVLHGAMQSAMELAEKLHVHLKKS